MPFVPGKSGNANGRPKGTSFKEKYADKSRADVGRDDLMAMLRKLKPLQKEALARLGVLLRDEETTETNRLKAIILILDKYKDLVQELYIDAEDKDDGATEKDKLESAPVFSLKMIKSEDTKDN